MSDQGEKKTYLTSYEQFLFNQLPKPFAIETPQTNGEESNILSDTNKALHKHGPLQMATLKSIPDESGNKHNRKRKLIKRKWTPRNAPHVKSSPQRVALKKRKEDSDEEAAELSYSVSDETDSSDEPTEVFEEEPFKAYECKICSFETIYEGVFNEHLLTHKRKETFHKCPRCSFKVKCTATVKKHMVIDRPDGEVNYCGLYVYSNECGIVLDAHLRVHGDESDGGVGLEYSYTAT